VVPTNKSDWPRSGATSIASESGNQRRYNRHSVWQAKSAGTLVAGWLLCYGEEGTNYHLRCRRVETARRNAGQLREMRDRSLSVP